MMTLSSVADASAMRVSQFPGPFGANPPKAPFSVGQALEGLAQIALPADLANLLRPLFRELGYQLVDKPIRDRRGISGRTVSCATNGWREIYLVSVVSDVFEAPTDPVGYAVVGTLHRVFPTKSAVYILSPEYYDFDPLLVEDLETWRESDEISASFVSWGVITRLDREKDFDARLKRFLLTFKINASPGNLLQKTEKIIEILARKLNNIPTRVADSVGNFLSASGLDKAGLHPAGVPVDDPAKAARFILDWTTRTRRDFPVGHAHEGQPTLGAVLKFILDTNPEPEEKQEVDDIAADLSLIRKMLN